MNALDQLNQYLRRLESRLKFAAVSRGAAVAALAALAATVLLVLLANRFAFSEISVTGARVLLFLALAFAIAFGTVLPLLKLNRRTAARRAEQQFPEFEQRLLTLAEKNREESGPFLELLAANTVEVARTAEPERVAPRSLLIGFLSAAAGSVITLFWLAVSGPGFIGHGAALLWAGTPKAGSQPFYEIRVSPGDAKVRRGSDQLVSAHLMGFQSPRVRLFARFRSSTKWEETPMQAEAGGSGHEFLLAGISENIEYYVEAGGIRSKHFTLGVVDLPAIRHIRITYNYPAWLNLASVVDESTGDLRAVEGTEAEVAIQFDRPLAQGVLIIDNENRIALNGAGQNWYSARLKMSKDGIYHVAALEQNAPVRLSEDFFISIESETPPLVRIRRPGRDARVNPIEEVPVEVTATDDFGLRAVELRFAVNGGPEKVVPLLKNKDAKEADGSTLIALEDFRLVPGDLVSLYAVARDARSTSQTDIYFIEAQPFEREYSQSQQMGGGEGGGEQQDNNISQRQKEIIAATWNELRAEKKSNPHAAENARFLSEVQGKLRDQARSLAKRMRSRQLSGTNQEFQSFSKDMEAAAEAMNSAVDQLKSQAWRAALPPEQKALQHLLRAESVFRQIQVAFGSRGGGGGGQGGRDLENLFDLELDTEKNQYETGQRSASTEQRSREIDEALQKLKQLAKRQQELAQQQRNQSQSFQQRWQQEMLRREAEELKRRMQELAQNSGSQQPGQQSSQQSGQSAQSSSSGQQRRMQHGQPGGDPRLERALERLEQATRDMRNAGSQQNFADSRRAAERLQEARDALGGMRRQQASGQLDDLSQRAGELASRQRNFADKLRQMYGREQGQGLRPGASRQDVERLADEKQGMLSELQRLERDMKDSVRDLAGTERAASSKLREALGDMQQSELGLRMKFQSEYIRRGLGAYAWMREQTITQGLDRLTDQVKEAQRALGESGSQEENQGLKRSLAQVEELRNRLQRQMSQLSRQQGQRGQQGQQGQPGQQGAQGQRGVDGLGRHGVPGGLERGGGYSAMNRGDLPGPIGRAPDPSAVRGLERAYSEGLRNLSELRRDLQTGAPEMDLDVQQLIREMQQLDPKRFPGNPALLEKIHGQVLPALEQLELQLRRQVDGGRSDQVLTGASEKVPTGYADAVAEYFRRLSKTR
ncbi:MAG: hypothetical protein HUU41_14480 [Bryobacteraceae bacterium]|nr:hypothetical protein [Bryobacterales bacterium]NUN02317.1 hypothetical protein [Bryobacteraceae bacterium]